MAYRAICTLWQASMAPNLVCAANEAYAAEVIHAVNMMRGAKEFLRRQQRPRRHVAEHCD